MSWIRFALCLPSSLLVSWPFALATRLLFSGELKFEKGCILTNQFPKDGWFGRGLYKKWAGTTVGHGIMYKEPYRQDESDPSATQVHEWHHTKQYEAGGAAGLMLGLLVWWASGSLWSALVVWFMAPWCWFFGSFLMAVLSGGHVYRDSVHEVSAYAVGDAYAGGKRNK